MLFLIINGISEISKSNFNLNEFFKEIKIRNFAQFDWWKYYYFEFGFFDDFKDCKIVIIL